jgi:hypothetical protein
VGYDFDIVVPAPIFRENAPSLGAGEGGNKDVQNAPAAEAAAAEQAPTAVADEETVAEEEAVKERPQPHAQDER